MVLFTKELVVKFYAFKSFTILRNNMILRAKTTVGESHPENEDFYHMSFGGKRVKAAVGDWARNKVGKYKGGVIGSASAQKRIALSEKTGYELIEELNDVIKGKYLQLEIDYVKGPELRFTGYIGHVIVTPETTKITSVGDVRVAVDGKIVAGKTKKVDIRNAKLRKEYIGKTGDIEGSYKHIEKYILEQFGFQNNPDHELCYPAIDGTVTVPIEEIDILEIPTPKHILIWSDGYVTPKEYTIEGLDKEFERMYEVDPCRIGEFLNTGFIILYFL